MSRPTSVPTYPVSLVLGGLRCLVVGGGPVAARKARGLLSAGAALTVVAPEVGEALTELAAEAPATGGGPLEVLRRPYRAGEAASYRLVVTATGDEEVDRRVMADASEAAVFCNSADPSEATSFLVPAVHRQGSVTVAVSTGGGSPALAAWLRDRVAAVVGPEVAAMASLMEEARQRLRQEGRSADALDWAKVLRGPFPSLVEAGELQAAREALDEAVRAALRVGPP